VDKELLAPKLEGWMIATEAAEYLGVSKTTVQKMMKAGKFKTMWSVGNKPIYLLLTSEVDALKQQRDLAFITAAVKKLDKEQALDKARYGGTVELEPSQ
jgi:excisionase family DNA binding protein